MAVDIRYSISGLSNEERSAVSEILNAIENRKKITRQMLRALMDWDVENLSLSEFCNNLGITRQNADNWRVEGMSLGEKGGYNLKLWFRWYRETKVRAKPKVDNSLQQNRKLKAEADLAEIKTLQIQEKLVDRETALGVIGTYITNCASIFDDLPKRLGALIPQNLRSKLIPEIKSSLFELKKECSEAKSEL